VPGFLERGGAWLAVQGPLMLAAAALPPWLGRFASGPSLVVGYALLAIGVAVHVWGWFGLGHSFTAYPKPLATGTLSTRGPYRFARHPLYITLVVAAAGWALLWQSIAGAICVALLFAFFDFKSRREETWLEEKYADYPAYRRRVKRFIPFLY
jgi:protein-S-isoprenylcysteine O-methyltransferase Ste14